MREFHQLAWTTGIIPMQRIMAGEVSRSLLPDFEGNPKNFEVKFDYSRVAALQKNQTAVFERVNKGVAGGWLTVAEGKRMMGLEPVPQDDVYLRSIATIEVPAGRKRASDADKKLRLVARH
jgi:hypothetical protein